MRTDAVDSEGKCCKGKPGAANLTRLRLAQDMTCRRSRFRLIHSVYVPHQRHDICSCLSACRVHAIDLAHLFQNAVTLRWRTHIRLRRLV